MSAAGVVTEHQRACLVALAGLPGIGPASLLACLGSGEPDQVWRSVRAGHPKERPELDSVDKQKDPEAVRLAMVRAAAALEPDALLARHRGAGVQVLVRGDTGYPARLAMDPAPPAVLFALGDLASVQGPTVAIVGTRNATTTGRATAGELARELSIRGVSVVSGLALGIDGAAHQAVVDACAARPVGERSPEGTAVGVVASGLDRAYPKRHELLHRQVVACGALVCEVPLGTQPLPWRFPARNRIIAGLADAVVVVESRSAGGSMLTAAEAIARNVPVLAVPGHPRAPAAAGALDLLYDGAVPLRDVGDVLVAIGLGGRKPLDVRSTPPAAGGRVALPVPLTAEQRRVLDVLAVAPRAFGEVVAAAGLAVPAAAAVLVELEGSGLVTRSGGWFECSAAGVDAAAGPAAPAGTR